MMDKPSQGRNQRKISGGAEITLCTDCDVINVQSTMTQLFRHNQSTNSCGINIFKMGGISAIVQVKKSMEDFFH